MDGLNINLLYLVALKSPREERKLAAEALMSSLKEHSKTLIEQALLVSHELIRVAILWQEEWHESLEEASQLYFERGNIQGMLDTLLPMHKMIQRNGVFLTQREENFVNTYGKDLHSAWEYIDGYVNIMREKKLAIPTSGATIRKSDGYETQEHSYLHSAWDLYYKVFKAINAEMQNLTSLDLQYTSPALKECRNLDLGVPGTYSVSGMYFYCC